jgi:hypothetical protein
MTRHHDENIGLIIVTGKKALPTKIRDIEQKQNELAFLKSVLTPWTVHAW